MTGAAPRDEPIRPAATLCLIRQGPAGPEVLMGQRGTGAVFMPSKVVFPGGGVDPADGAAPRDAALGPACARRLALHPLEDTPAPGAFAAAAARELDEETGLRLRPEARLIHVFRAITPPGRSRRFDARFFLARAEEALEAPAEGFGRASGELSHLGWRPMPQARGLDLPFITEVVLAEISAILAGHPQPGVPFFDNRDDRPVFRRLA
jgi:8-oxo-dGTP pyrophosphatase MutT (NUDIX family)